MCCSEPRGEQEAAAAAARWVRRRRKRRPAAVAARAGGRHAGRRRRALPLEPVYCMMSWARGARPRSTCRADNPEVVTAIWCSGSALHHNPRRLGPSCWRVVHDVGCPHQRHVDLLLPECLQAFQPPRLRPKGGSKTPCSSPSVCRRRRRRPRTQRRFGRDATRSSRTTVLPRGAGGRLRLLCCVHNCAVVLVRRSVGVVVCRGTLHCPPHPHNLPRQPSS